MSARLPDDEAERLAVLKDHQVLDTPPTEEFDDLVRLAAQVCGVPIAAVSLIDEHRQWFKAITGLDITETPRSDAFCAHTILQSDVMVVPDALADQRFQDNPLVTDGPNIRFYAGAPLVSEEGYALGSLCVIDREPRQLTAQQMETLRLLARQVTSQLNAARRVVERERLVAEKEQIAAEKEQIAAERSRSEADRLRLAAIIETCEDAVFSKTLDGTITNWNAGAERLYGYDASEIIGQNVILLVPPDCGGEVVNILAAIRRGERVAPLETVRLTKAGVRVDMSLRVSHITDTSGRVIGASVIARDISERKRAESTLEAERVFTHALLESLQEGIVACDAQGTLTLFNRAMRGFHGLPEQTLPREQRAEHFGLFHADGLTPMEMQDIPLFRALQGEAVRDAEVVIAPKDGPPLTLLANGQAIYDTHGDKLGAVVALHNVTERRQAERELARLAAIVESSEEAILAATLDGTLVSWNKGAERLYGYAAADMIGQHASVLTPSGQQSPVSDVIRRLVRGEAVEPMEVARERQDGSAFSAMLSFSPIRGAEGHMIGLSCITRDITLRKRAEAALTKSNDQLQESEERLRRLAEAAFEGISVSRDGILADVNPAFAELFGYKEPVEMIGVGAAQLCALESRALVLQKITEGDERPYEAVLQRRDGTTFWAEVRARLTQLNGRPARVTAIRDITERKAIEEERRVSHHALRKNEARLEEAQRIAKVGSWEYDPHDGKVTWSDEMFRLLGRDPQTGVPDFGAAMALYHPKDSPVLKSLVARAAQEGVGYELDLRGSPSSFGGGDTRWYHTTGEPVTDTAGKVVRLMGTVADITERKRLEEGLHKSGEALREREARLRAILDSAPIILYAADANGMMTLSEGTGLAALGLNPGEAVGRSVFEFSNAPETEANTRRALAGEAVSYDAKMYGLCLHTELRPVLGADGILMGIIGVCFDVTERVLSEERFRALFERSSHAHLLFSEIGGIIDCNAAALSMMRCSDKGQLLGMHPALLSPENQPDGRRSDEKGAEMCALARANGGHRFEWRRRTADGYEYPVEVTLTPVTLEGKPVLLSVWHDLTERKRQEEQIKDHAVILEYQKKELERANAELEALATTDGLTGLKNHRAFQERLSDEVCRAARYATPLSLILLDVDHFKQFNDAYGHPAGDAVLRSVSRVLQDGARDTDIVARYGGEEFVLILPQTDAGGAAVLAERLREALEGHSWPVRAVTASFGVATLRLAEESGTELLARADAGTYQSKAEGRNRVTFVQVSASERWTP